jgi:hypothetical protein
MPVIIDLGRVVVLLRTILGSVTVRAYLATRRVFPLATAALTQRRGRLTARLDYRRVSVRASNLSSRLFIPISPAQAKKVEQSDPAIVVMIIPVSPTSVVGRAGR